MTSLILMFALSIINSNEGIKPLRLTLLQKILTLLRQLFADQSLSYANLIDPLNEADWGKKITVRPIIIKGRPAYQFTSFKGNQTFHRNVSERDILSSLAEAMMHFKQAVIRLEHVEFHLQLQGEEFSWKKKEATTRLEQVSHNRAKQHPLPDGVPDNYLIGLGLMSVSGKVIAAKAHKFRQINRFLELVEQTLGDISTTRPFHIVDLGCGKAYLTFALYHYLHEVKGIPVLLSGVDRREDVISQCRTLAKTLNYSNLQFHQEDIGTFQPATAVDAVVSLHACDTATDDALASAIEWKAKYIFAAPCCQHELFKQVDNCDLNAILRHGILKERFAAMATDAARTELLMAYGYKAQVIEFIDLEHSPKNLMIRAEKSPSPKQQEIAWESYLKLKHALSIEPRLEKLLAKQSRA